MAAAISLLPHIPISALPAIPSAEPATTACNIDTAIDHTISSDHSAAAQAAPRLPLELVRLIIQHSAHLTPGPSTLSSSLASSSSSDASPQQHAPSVPASLPIYKPTPLYIPSYDPSLHPPRNATDLRAACLVDRAWRDLGARELYKHVQVTEQNAARALGALWRCVRAAQRSDVGVEVEGMQGEQRAGMRMKGAEERMRVKMLELVSLPDCAGIHASPGVAELYGQAAPSGAAKYDVAAAEHVPTLGALAEEAGGVDRPVQIDHLIIHDAALWTLALAYTFDRHHRTTHPPSSTSLSASSPSSLPSVALTSPTTWESTPHKHPYLSLLAHLSPRKITIHYPSAQRATYLRRRSYIPICCGRPECRAALAKLWSAPVVPRDVVRDICDELWPRSASALHVDTCFDDRNSDHEQMSAKMRDICVGGVVDEQPPMLSFIHPPDTSHSACTLSETLDEEIQDDLLDKLHGRYSITFASCLCANPIYADDYCPNHVSIERRAMQVAAVLDGRLGLAGARVLAKVMLVRATAGAARLAGQDDDRDIIVEGSQGEDDIAMTGESNDTAMSTEAVLCEEATTAPERENECQGDVADVLLQRDGNLLELRNVSSVGWTSKTPEEVRVAIWQEAWDMLAM